MGATRCRNEVMQLPWRSLYPTPGHRAGLRSPPTVSGRRASTFPGVPEGKGYLCCRSCWITDGGVVRCGGEWCRGQSRCGKQCGYETEGNAVREAMEQSRRAAGPFFLDEAHLSPVIPVDSHFSSCMYYIHGAITLKRPG